MLEEIKLFVENLKKDNPNFIEGLDSFEKAVSSNGFDESIFEKEFKNG